MQAKLWFEHLTDMMWIKSSISQTFAEVTLLYVHVRHLEETFEINDNEKIEIQGEQRICERLRLML